MEFGDQHVNQKADGLEDFVLKSASSLTTELDLTGCNLSEAALHAVARVLARSKTIKTVLLARNNIGDRGMEVLAEGLKDNRSCQHYYLGYNNISGKGAQILSDALAGNSAVLRLNICNNPIGPRGASALAHLAINQPNLTQLVVDGCGLDSDAMQVFEELIARNSGMTCLSLWNNSTTQDFRKKMAATLQGHATLVSVDLPEPIVNMQLAQPHTRNRG